MFAMKISSVSMRYGSPRHALVITLCISPCADERVLPRERLVDAHRRAVGVDRELVGVGRDSRAAPRRAACSAGSSSGELNGCGSSARCGAGTAPCGGSRRARSIVPSTLISTASARIVWKPFECAARPRIAWNATGLPVTVACSLAPGVGPGDRQLERLVAARCRPSRARACGCVAAGMPVIAAAHSGVQSAHALAQQLERRRDAACRRPACTRRRAPGSAPSACDRHRRDCAMRSHHSLLCGSCSGRRGRVRRPGSTREQAVSSLAGVEHRRAAARWCSARGTSRSSRPRAISSCSSAMKQRAVGARADRDPLVGDRRVAGAHRVDRDEAAAAALELRDRDLERIASDGPRRCRSSRTASRGRGRGRRIPRTRRRSCRSSRRPC